MSLNEKCLFIGGPWDRQYRMLEPYQLVVKVPVVGWKYGMSPWTEEGCPPRLEMVKDYSVVIYHFTYRTQYGVRVFTTHGNGLKLMETLIGELEMSIATESVH